MATGVAIAGLAMGGVSLVGGYKSYQAQKDAAGKQADLDALNRRNMAAEGAETIRRTGLNQKDIQSQMRVDIAGSGFRTGNAGRTPLTVQNAKQAYFNKVSRAHQEDLNWLKKATDMGIDIAGKEASLRYSAAQDRATAGAINTVASVGSSLVSTYGTYKQMTGGTDWWSSSSSASAGTTT